MTTLRKLPTIAPKANAKKASSVNIHRRLYGERRTQNAECRMQNAEWRNQFLSSFLILHSKFCIHRPLLPSPPQEPGGEWGLVASAVFKTVVSARKRRKVGSIPTRLRHAAGGPTR